MVSFLLRHPLLQAPLRVAAGMAWLVLATVSLAPARSLPGVGASGEVERALAFGAAALVTRLAFRFTRSRWHLAAFAAAAALVGVCRLTAPDGRAGVEAWTLDVVAAFTGIGVGRVIDHLSWRLRPDA